MKGMQHANKVQTVSYTHLNEADSRIVAIMQGTAALRIYLARAEGREAVIHVRNYDRRVRIIPSEFEQIRLEV